MVVSWLREIFEAMGDQVTVHMCDFVREHAPGHSCEVHLLGASGTVTTIAGVAYWFAPL